MRSRLRQGWYNVWGWTSYRVASNCLRYFQSSKIDGRKGYTCSLLLWMLWKSCWWVYVALLRSVAVFHIFLYSLVIFFSVFPTLNSWPKKSEEVFPGKFRSKAIVDRSGSRLQAKDVATLPHEDTGPAFFLLVDQAAFPKLLHGSEIFAYPGIPTTIYNNGWTYITTIAEP